MHKHSCSTRGQPRMQAALVVAASSKDRFAAALAESAAATSSNSSSHRTAAAPVAVQAASRMTAQLRWDRLQPEAGECSQSRVGTQRKSQSQVEGTTHRRTTPALEQELHIRWMAAAAVLAGDSSTPDTWTHSSYHRARAELVGAQSSTLHRPAAARAADRRRTHCWMEGQNHRALPAEAHTSSGHTEADSALLQEARNSSAGTAHTAADGAVAEADIHAAAHTPAAAAPVPVSHRSQAGSEVFSWANVDLGDHNPYLGWVLAAAISTALF